MAQALDLKGHERVLEIKTQLSEQAKRHLQSFGASNIHLKTGDGYFGWPEVSPFDIIVLTAAPPHIPLALFEQLKPKGRLLAPVGELSQSLNLYTFNGHEWVGKELLPVQFVPMV